MSNFLFINAFCFSSLAWAQPITLKVVNLEVARQALAGGAQYIQNRQALRPDKLNYEKPYCFSFANHFSLDASKTYFVADVASSQVEDSETWQIKLTLNTQSPDPLAQFSMTCFAQAPKKTDLDDAIEALRGVYAL